MLRVVSHHRPKSGHITCDLNRTYHVLLTNRLLILAVGAVRVYGPHMNNLMNVVGVLGMLFVCVFPALFVLFIALWYMNRNDRKPNYLRRVARKYSVSPLFGKSRLTLLREAQKLRS